MSENLENSTVAIELEKVQFSFQSQRRSMPKILKCVWTLPSRVKTSAFSPDDSFRPVLNSLPLFKTLLWDTTGEKERKGF